MNYQTTSARLIVSSGWFCVWVTYTPSKSEVVVLVGMKKTNNTAEPTHTEAKRQYTLALWPSIACINREHENTMETLGKKEVVKKLIYRWAAGTHKPRCIFGVHDVLHVRSFIKSIPLTKLNFFPDNMKYQMIGVICTRV